MVLPILWVASLHIGNANASNQTFMKIADFELELKKIDENFNLVPHPVNLDMCGVYYKKRYLFAIPNGEIYEEPNPDYRNGDGRAHRCARDARAIAEKYVFDLNNDPEFKAMEEEVI